MMSSTTYRRRHFISLKNALASSSLIRSYAEQFLSKSSLNSFLCTAYTNQEIFRLVYQEFRGDKQRKKDIQNSWYRYRHPRLKKVQKELELPPQRTAPSQLEDIEVSSTSLGSIPISPSLFNTTMASDHHNNFSFVISFM